MLEAACVRATEAVLMWAHVRPDGEPWWTVLLGRGLWGTFTEVLAHAEDWENAFLGWWSSPSHSWALDNAVEQAACQVGNYFAIIVRLQ